MEKLPESIESSRLVSQRTRMSREFDLSKDSQSKQFKRRPQRFVKLSFTELRHSKLSKIIWLSVGFKQKPTDILTTRSMI